MDNLVLAYIIFAVVFLHVILGFVWVIYKFSKKKKSEMGGSEEVKRE